MVLFPFPGPPHAHLLVPPLGRAPSPHPRARIANPRPSPVAHPSPGSRGCRRIIRVPLGVGIMFSVSKTSRQRATR
ncbi:hypothetical protein K438DRAFT_1857472 [Mycena galopus ATCC 62051]|nr:hypothetical protein K438DRAFT_1857472 [Mycena galopus ATCC 62051]